MKKNDNTYIRLRYIILFVIVWLTGIQGWSQPAVEKGYFRSPVDFPISLSGSFAEVRANHFHSGIDIRTGGITGKPVYAAANGYVSRVYVSPYGFGKAVYINHPSGYTSVYAHLDRFNSRIATYAKTRQYEKESFFLDEYIGAGKIQVRKGEVIGYSGNSGSSGGPHLHFEIRELHTQDPLDPVSYGIPVTDNLPPQIRGIRIYPMNAEAMVDYAHQPKSYPVTGSNGRYRLQQSDTIRVSGEICFGIEAYDYHETSSIRCGVKSIELFVDKERVFGQRIDRFAFSETRYVNAIVDYASLQQTKKRYQRSVIEPGNPLNLFFGVKNRGFLVFTRSNTHTVTYVVQDSHGNTSRLDFEVTSHSPPPGKGQSVGPELNGIPFRWNQINRYASPDVVFSLPEGALYTDILFTCQTKPGTGNLCSPVVQLHTADIPLHLNGELMIRPVGLPDALRSKAVIVRIDKTGKTESKGGSWQDGFVKTRVREFGEYGIRVDTLEPTVTPRNIYNGKKLTTQRTLSVKISDDLSGIATYRGTLNGNWILMDYDGKSGTLTYTIDDRMKEGENRFRLVVTDGVGNSRICEYKLFHVGL